MEAIMNLKSHHTIQELKTLYRIETDARLAGEYTEYIWPPRD
jgi:hypothetical protein